MSGSTTPATASSIPSLKWISPCVRDTFDTNFFGALAAMQAVIPIMRKQASGAIINISSVAGHIPLPFHAIYSATKFAYERALAKPRALS